MRKLFAMLIMVGMAVAFTACSSDDNSTPQNPVSNINCPSSAKIGSEVTVQGVGFGTTGLELYMNDSKVDASFSSAGVTFTMPYTLVSGTTITLSLKQGDNSWTLGTINVLAADNPITALSVPEQMGYNTSGTQTVTINGVGFETGDKIVFESNGETKAVTGTATTDGLQITVPTLTDGEYILGLARGNSTWALSDTPVYVYQEKRIKSIEITSPYASFYGLKSFTLDFAYNSDGTLSGITSNYDGFNYTFAYATDKVTVTTGSGQTSDYTLVDGRITKNTDIQANLTDPKYPDEPDNVWTYDADGYLVSVANNGKWYAASNIKDVTYTDCCLAEMDFGGTVKFTYDKSIHSVPGTLDPAFLVNFFANMLAKEDAMLGLMLSQNLSISKYVPTVISVEDYDESFNVVFTDMMLTTSFENNVLTIDCYGQNTNWGFYGSKAVVTYENK